MLRVVVANNVLMQALVELFQVEVHFAAHVALLRVAVLSPESEELTAHDADHPAAERLGRRPPEVLEDFQDCHERHLHDVRVADFGLEVGGHAQAPLSPYHRETTVEGFGERFVAAATGFLQQSFEAFFDGLLPPGWNAIARLPAAIVRSVL
jgi:hypothetical protein